MEPTRKIKRVSQRKPKDKLDGNNIKEYMDAKGMSSDELSYKADVDPSFLSRIINNNRLCISLPTAMRIALVLECTVEQLFIYTPRRNRS